MTPWQSARTAALGLVRHRGASLVAVATLAFMLSALTLFILIADGMGTAASQLESKANLIADVRGNAGQVETRALQVRIGARFPNVRLTFVSRHAAVERFRHTFIGNSTMLAALEGNPLPASIEVRTHDPSVLPRVGRALRRSGLVSRLIFNPDLTRKLVEITSFIKLAGACLVAGLALLSLLIVINTTHLTVEGRRDEIEVMKLVGATHAFVRDPLILEGILLGLGGGGIATVAGLLFYLPALKAILAGSGSAALSILPINTHVGFLAVVMLAVVGVGAFIGATGSYISVRRFAHF